MKEDARKSVLFFVARCEGARKLAISCKETSEW